jgi:hypothetical protein
MRKYIFTESQIKGIIDGVISEQSGKNNKEDLPFDPATVKNRKLRKAIIANRKTIADREAAKTAPATGGPTPPLKTNTKALKGGKMRPTTRVKPGGGLKTTGRGHIQKCAGGGCNLREQDENTKQTKAVQNFLNTRLKANLQVDGLAGPETQKAIEKYQGIIHVFPTDGVWGPETEKLMPANDKKIYDDYVRAQGDIIDKVLNLLR